MTNIILSRAINDFEHLQNIKFIGPSSEREYVYRWVSKTTDQPCLYFTVDHGTPKSTRAPKDDLSYHHDSLWSMFKAS